MACASRPAQSRPDLRVLVVEDEALLLFDLVDMLSTAGFAVVEAGADGEAMAVLHTNAMIDILITDIQLGGDQSGWDLAEAYRGIRSDERGVGKECVSTCRSRWAPYH